MWDSSLVPRKAKPIHFSYSMQSMREKLHNLVSLLSISHRRFLSTRHVLKSLNCSSPISICAYSIVWRHALTYDERLEYLPCAFTHGLVIGMCHWKITPGRLSLFSISTTIAYSSLTQAFSSCIDSTLHLAFFIPLPWISIRDEAKANKDHIPNNKPPNELFIRNHWAKRSMSNISKVLNLLSASAELSTWEALLVCPQYVSFWMDIPCVPCGHFHRTLPSHPISTRVATGCLSDYSDILCPIHWLPVHQRADCSHIRSSLTEAVAWAAVIRVT